MSKLPDWGKDDLPEPPPFSMANMFRMVGPGAILLAASIGGGEWFVGPTIAVKYGSGLLWIATVGIVLQVLLNLEAIRYTLYTGEPIFSGIMRLRPGAKVWGTFYAILTAAQLGLPALAGMSAAVIFAGMFSKLPGGGDSNTLLYITYGVMSLGVLLLLFGGTIERMLERLSWVMITYIFAFLIVVNVAFVPLAHSRDTFSGFFNFGYMPEGVEILLLASLAATAGSGGIGNLAISNWIRDKGFGMGGKVGAIPSAFGSKEITLSHVGKVFPVTDENLRRWKLWWKYVVADQVWLWGLGCFLGMFLNVNLATAIIPAGENIDGIAAGAYQAEFMARSWWHGLWILGLLNGFWILFSTHLGNTDILVRTITDIIWVSSDKVRSAKRLNVAKVYYLLLAGFTVWGVFALQMGKAADLFKILAAVAGLVLVPSSIQILIVNTRLLPKELRPSWWRRCALVCCSLFYLGVSLSVLWDKLRPN